jgi:hypothetical protein
VPEAVDVPDRADGIHVKQVSPTFPAFCSKLRFSSRVRADEAWFMTSIFAAQSALIGA